MSSPVAPASLARIAADVEQRLRGFLDVELARWADFEPDLAEPMAEIGRLVLVGGKRLRPAFCHWGFVGAGGDPTDPRVVDAGAAFELMHAFALFHDDVMDDASSRRGTPTTHTVYAEHHRRGGWAGEARRFGEGVAILVGDLAFVYADRLMSSASPAAYANRTPRNSISPRTVSGVSAPGGAAIAGGTSIADAVTQANTAVVDKARADTGMLGMGTTMTAAIEVVGGLRIGHVGRQFPEARRGAGRAEATLDQNAGHAAVVGGEPQRAGHVVQLDGLG